MKSRVPVSAAVIAAEIVSKSLNLTKQYDIRTFTKYRTKRIQIAQSFDECFSLHDNGFVMAMDVFDQIFLNDDAT